MSSINPLAEQGVLPRIYPERRIGSFSRAEGRFLFYSLVADLLTPEAVVLDYGAGRGAQIENSNGYMRRLIDFSGRCKRYIGVDPDLGGEATILISTRLTCSALREDPACRCQRRCHRRLRRSRACSGSCCRRARDSSRSEAGRLVLRVDAQSQRLCGYGRTTGAQPLSRPHREGGGAHRRPRGSRRVPRVLPDEHALSHPQELRAATSMTSPSTTTARPRITSTACSWPASGWR